VKTRAIRKIVAWPRPRNYGLHQTFGKGKQHPVWNE